MKGHPLVVVGIGHDGPAGLSAEACAHVAGARILAGGRRHLAFFPQWSGEKVVVEGDLEAVIVRLRERYAAAKTVVLASGDPLFYGIGRLLLQSFPRDDLVFLPQVTSVQLAFARLKETWHDARVVSLHGRPIEALLPALQERAVKIAVLTDGKNHPVAVADFLRRHGAAEDYALWVCENLGGSDERLSRYAPASVKDETFSPLNVVVLLRIAEPRSTGETGEDGIPLLGIPENALLHGAGLRGMITRREVRLMALCYLELRHGDAVWDIGAGSGSVAIEAARLSDGLRVFAVERDADAFRQLEANIARLGIGRVRAVRADAPEGLLDLPDPDAVFVGGSGGRLRGIIAAAVHRLKPGGRIVINCITLENLARAWDGLCEQGLQPEATSVQLSHSRPLGCLHSLEPDNLIFILRARKP